jgi:uncharacterized protein YktB (UPF0637 family)
VEAVLAHLVSVILSHQEELAARAVKRLGDVNEAHLLVGRVVSRAMRDMRKEEAEEAVSASMSRELDALLSARRAN